MTADHGRTVPYTDPDTRWINSAQYPPPARQENRIRYPYPNRLGLTTQR